MRKSVWQVLLEDMEKYRKSISQSDYQSYIREFLEKKKTEFKEEDFVQVCPEPIEFISAFDNEKDQEQCKEKMKEMIATNPKFQKVQLNQEMRQKGMWIGNTKNGINLHPGKPENPDDKAITLNDDIVHGVIVGRTGSGKSVFLHHLIMTMLYEYAPWELDLYLADFKQVELSRYMSKKNAQTPHLRTCAATSEIRYIVSMFEHLEACMKARQQLLKKLGIQKLSDFRKEFKVVLPRVLVLVDEFQQMYVEADTKNGQQIKTLIYRIIKLGRATGFHLLFASQEMNGALNATELANFKARFALSCDSAISSEIIGNGEAANLNTGWVIANTNLSKDNVIYNKKYQVPFIKADDEENGEESYFYKQLTYFSTQTKECKFSKQQIFYQEEVQEEIDDLENTLENIQEQRTKELGELYYDAITLGYGVVYSDKKKNLESFNIERGHNKNIIAICNDIKSLAYVQKLLALNFKYSPKQIEHIYYNFNRQLFNIYSITDDLTNIKIKTEEELKDIQKTYNDRQKTYKEIQEIQKLCNNIPKKNDNSEMIKILLEREKKDVLQFLDKYKELVLEEKKAIDEEKWSQQVEDISQNCFDKEGNLLKDKIFPILKEQLESNLEECPATLVYDYYENKGWEDIFEPIHIWISGLEYTEKGLPKELEESLKKGMDVNMLFLFFASSVENDKGLNPLPYCDYSFAKGEQEAIYTKLKMDFSKRSQNDIVIDFKIKSWNKEQAFKKYRVKFEDRNKISKLDYEYLV